MDLLGGNCVVDYRFVVTIRIMFRRCATAAAMVRTAPESMARVTDRYQEVPAADLVLIRAGQAFAGLELLLDRPARPGDLDQGSQRDRPRAVQQASSPDCDGSA